MGHYHGSDNVAVRKGGLGSSQASAQTDQSRRLPHEVISAKTRISLEGCRADLCLHGDTYFSTFSQLWLLCVFVKVDCAH